ncbi:MAG: B12-binding domain-containing radical SAM protein [Promethearchaeota archaeon]
MLKRALLIYPIFSAHGFWNYQEVCKLVGKKYPASPLGLITVAALFPKDWEIKLIDMNVEPLNDSDIKKADLVFIGGMISQQIEFCRLIDYIHKFGKEIVVGGPDPTSQPEIFQNADYLVLGEAEQTLPSFFNDYEIGKAKKIYAPPEIKPDMTKSPLPRFDLLKLNAYMMVGIQLTRGCPFNCEFCDIIELFGRKPRMKNPDQIINELDTLYNLGYRGHIDFVDDNFIGNKKRVKIILKDIIEWSKPRKYPFYFSTEASINLADDEELMKLMRDCDFRYVFVGIETPDESILISTHKLQNTHRKIEDDLSKIQHYGMIVNAGFIIGFDHETSAKTRSIVDLVRIGKIPFAMVGLMNALPNTQLTRRLVKENRFLSESNTQKNLNIGSVDQTTAGLNFVTDRPKEEVINDYIYVIENIFNTKQYFNRCLNLALGLHVKPKFKPGLKAIPRTSLSLFKLIFLFGIKPKVGYYFWRNLFKTLFIRPSSIEPLINVEAMFLHFTKQSKFIVKVMNERMEKLKENPEKVLPVKQEILVESLN